MTTTTTSPRTRIATTLAAAFACSFTMAACGGGDTSAASTPAAAANETATSEIEAPPSTLIDINKATEAELLTIPGVGPEIADEIMEYRPYESFATFREELAKYISDDEIARIETYLTLG